MIACIIKCFICYAIPNGMNESAFLATGMKSVLPLLGPLLSFVDVMIDLLPEHCSYDGFEKSLCPSLHGCITCNFIQSAPSTSPASSSMIGHPSLFSMHSMGKHDVMKILMSLPQHSPKQRYRNIKKHFCILKVVLSPLL
jgi:hypothetical protein